MMMNYGGMNTMAPGGMNNPAIMERLKRAYAAGGLGTQSPRAPSLGGLAGAQPMAQAPPMPPPAPPMQPMGAMPPAQMPPQGMGSPIGQAMRSFEGPAADRTALLRSLGAGGGQPQNPMPPQRPRDQNLRTRQSGLGAPFA